MFAEFDTPEANRVAKLLRGAGFHVAAPAEHKAKNPDFIVDGPDRFWAEVKSLADSAQIKAFDLAREYLAPRIKTVPCAIDLYVSEQAKHREFKILHELILKSVSIQRWPSFVLLSDKYVARNACSYTLNFESGDRALVFAYLDVHQQIVAPWQLDTPTFGQKIKIHPGGRETILRKYSDEFIIGAHLYQRPPYTGLIGTTHSRGMWKSTSQTRFRRDVARANKQISDACKLDDLPGVLFLIGFASRATFVCALLGDPMIAVPRNNSEPAEARYGRNGAFRPHQNTHISAAYLLTGDEIYFLANPFARQSIKSCFPSARIISIDSRGYVTGT